MDLNLIQSAKKSAALMENGSQECPGSNVKVNFKERSYLFTISHTSKVSDTTIHEICMGFETGIMRLVTFIVTTFAQITSDFTCKIIVPKNITNVFTFSFVLFTHHISQISSMLFTDTFVSLVAKYSNF